ncbi:DUF167 domain-containing protein [archaeon]|nr:DUF167 domain-containing protein [archaeon]
MKIIVKPNCPKNKLLEFDSVRGAYRVEVKAKPEGGKANLEVEKFLSKHFKKRVKIVSGFKSRQKIIEILE